MKLSPLHTMKPTWEVHARVNIYTATPLAQLILQPFSHFTYVTAHSPHLSVTSPTSQLIL